MTLPGRYEQVCPRCHERPCECEPPEPDAWLWEDYNIAALEELERGEEEERWTSPKRKNG